MAHSGPTKRKNVNKTGFSFSADDRLAGWVGQIHLVQDEEARLATQEGEFGVAPRVRKARVVDFNDSIATTELALHETQSYKRKE